MYFDTKAAGSVLTSTNLTSNNNKLPYSGLFQTKIFIQVPQNQFWWFYFQMQYISKYTVKYTTVSDRDNLSPFELKVLKTAQT